MNDNNNNNNNNLVPPLSSKMFQKKSIPLLFQKINNQRNTKGKGTINNYSSIEYETVNYHNYHNNNKLNFRKKLLNLSEIYAGKKLNLLDNTEFHKNIYQDSTIINAPSFSDNLSEIKKMIKIRKYQNFRNIFNRFVDSPFNSDYMKEFHMIKKRKLIFQRKNNFEQIKRNNSCEDLFDSKKIIKNKIKIDDSTQGLSTNCSKKLNSNFTLRYANNNNTQITRNKSQNNIFNLSTTRNKSIIDIKSPDRQSVSNISLNEDSKNSFQNNIILPKISINNKHNSCQTDSPLIHINLGGSFITEIKTDKIKFDINQLLKDRIIGDKIDTYEEKILKLKIYQTYQREKFKKILKDKQYQVQERIDFIIKMYKMYEKIFYEYINKLKNYNKFLYETANEMEIEMRDHNKIKININDEIEHLMGKLVDKQKKLEYLIKTRNFLFKMKNRDKKIIKLSNQYVYKISKRKNLIEKFCDLFGRNKESLTYKYLKELMSLEELEKVLKVKPAKSRVIARLSNIVRRTLKIDEKEKDLLSPPPLGEEIFQTPEEIIAVFEKIKNDDLNLMKNYEKIEKEKSELIAELNNDICLYEAWEKSDKINLKNRIKCAEDEKKKNLKLSEKYELMEDLINKNKRLSSLKSGFKIYSHKAFNDINYYNIIKYNVLRAKYKLDGLVLLEKLINNVNKIILINKEAKIFNLNDIYHYIPEFILSRILNMKANDFNKKNQFLIGEYSLKLIKLYEFFAESIMNKNKQNKNIDTEQYNKEREKIINERKIYNSKILKEMKKNKRNSSVKELLEKWNKKTVISTRKSDMGINFNSNEDIKNKKFKKNVDYFCDKFENILLYEE